MERSCPTCEEVFQRLQDYLDRELNPEEKATVEIHLEMCGPCAVEYRFEASVLKYMKGGFSKIDVPADLEARCLKAIRGCESS